MKISRWTIILCISLLAVSAAVFLLKIVTIGDNGSSNTLSYIFNALGFLPLNVLLVTLILNRMLSHRAARERQEKMKMVLGPFFNEFGSELMRIFITSDASCEEIRRTLSPSKSWKKEDYQKAIAAVSGMCKKTRPDAAALMKIKDILTQNHEFMLRLIENPVFLEHSTVSHLMQDFFHLHTELSARPVISDEITTDIAHLRGDVNRVYPNLVKVWLTHMEYLSRNYPYLLSYSLRTSPFMSEDDVIVKA